MSRTTCNECSSLIEEKYNYRHSLEEPCFCEYVFHVALTNSKVRASDDIFNMLLPMIGSVLIVPDSSHATIKPKYLFDKLFDDPTTTPFDYDFWLPTHSHDGFLFQISKPLSSVSSAKRQLTSAKLYCWKTCSAAGAATNPFPPKGKNESIVIPFDAQATTIISKHEKSVVLFTICLLAANVDFSTAVVSYVDMRSNEDLVFAKIESPLPYFFHFDMFEEHMGFIQRFDKEKCLKPDLTLFDCLFANTTNIEEIQVFSRGLEQRNDNGILTRCYGNKIKHILLRHYCR